MTETTVTATVNHSGASYVIKLGGVEDDGGVVSLSIGINFITVEVTAEDGQTTQTYTVRVVRYKSNNPPTGKPTISGRAEVGETLTADTSSIADEDGIAGWPGGGSWYFTWQSDRGHWLWGTVPYDDGPRAVGVERYKFVAP